MFCMGEDSLIRILVLQLVLYTRVFQGLLLFFLLLNLIAYGLNDYAYRLKEFGEAQEFDKNIVAYYLELICNLFFTVEFALRLVAIGVIFENYAYLRTGEGVMNFLLLILK